MTSKSFKVPLTNLTDPAECERQAENIIFRLCQKPIRENLKYFKANLINLDLQENFNGLFCVGGHIARSNLPEAMKHPIVLVKDTPLVPVYLEYYHKKYLHQGYRVILANLAQLGVLVVNGKSVLKSISAKCIFCRIRRRNLLSQRMAELPEFRVNCHTAPFQNVALDFFGNLKVRRTRNVVTDASVMLVTCTTTRCVHLELCSSIDANGFLLAWRRFSSARGIHPTLAFADGGTGFKAGEPVAEWVRNWDMELVTKGLAELGTKFDWFTNVPTASHMNGVAESLIRSVRKGLDAAIVSYRQTSLAFEEWDTILKEVTYLVNSRPLFPDGEPDEFHCITGNSILHPYNQADVPQHADEDCRNLRDMVKVAEAKVKEFWDTWLRHMPPQLNRRNKWYHARENLQVGDFVLNLQPGLKGGSAPRGTWLKAIVAEVHPSADGLIRSVTIRDSKHTQLKRPIHKLCLIATKQELENGLIDTGRQYRDLECSSFVEIFRLRGTDLNIRNKYCRVIIPESKD